MHLCAYIRADDSSSISCSCIFVKHIISGVVMALILDIHAQGEHGWEIVDTLLIEISAPSRRNAPIVIDGLRDAVERYFQGAVRTSEDDELIVGFDYEIRS